MLVKIGNEIYDSTKTPIMLIFDDKEIKHMQGIESNNYKYCSYPDDTKEEDIVEFMKVDEVDKIGFLQY